MAGQPETPVLNAGKVERLVSSMIQAVGDCDATLFEAYTASRSVQETFFQALSDGVDDKTAFRNLLDRIFEKDYRQSSGNDE